MGSDQILKKSVIGGFKKEGVLNYIEQLQTEIVGLKRELNNDKSEADGEISSLKNENESLKSENAGLIEANAAYALKIEESQVSIDEYRTKLQLCE